MSIQSRAAKARLEPCSVPRCGKHRHGISQYCDVHAQRSSRVGSPTGRAILPSEIAYYLDQARQFIVTNGEHNAIKEVIANLDNWFTTAARCVSTAKTNSFDHRLIRELHRLHSAEDVTGSEVLALCLAVYLLTQANPDRLEPMTRAHRFAVAKLVLKMTTKFQKITEGRNGTIKRRSARVSTVLLDKFGVSLIEETLSLCSKIAATLKQKERDDRARQERLAASLKEPFLCR